MIKRVLPWLAISVLVMATAVDAQPRGGGGGGGGRGGGGGGSSSGSGGRSAPGSAIPSTPINQIEIVGVVTAIDAPTSRVTIAYEPVEALNWPKGTMPFPVSNDELLKNVTVGQKVRFKVESHEIYTLQPY